jgi:DNA-binding winged helix-turn-helix (wHTH) protein/tetratricopeptide (TPR) repeat protein
MKGTLPQRVRLGVFEVDLRAGELRQDEGAVLVLPDQPLQILRILIEADGEIVTRDEIRQRLWPDDTIVEFDHSINNAIKKLRRALVDSGDEPHYIGTIAKRGYRLLVPVERVGTEEDGPAEPNQTADPSTRADTVDKSSSSVGQSIAEPRRGARWKWRASGALMACLAILAGALYWRAHRAPKLIESGTVVIADFANTTGNPIFDDALRQALSNQLSQSPFLNVLSDRNIRRALKEMNRSANDPLTKDTTREVCRHVDGKAMLAGSLDALRNDYVLGLKAIDCNTTNVLAEAQERVPDKDAVLKALEEATITIRKEMGEPLSSVQKYAMPAGATSPSLEAYKAFSMGLKARYEQGAEAALPFYKRAIELDPNFADPYVALAFAYANLGEHERAEDYARKAYQLRDKVSERERLLIESTYYFQITRELDKAARTYEEWQQIYPRDVTPVGNSDVIYSTLGNAEKALEASRAALRLEPNAGISYENLADDYLNLNRLDDAAAVLKQAEDRKLTSDQMLSHRYYLAFLQGDAAQMAQSAAAAMGKPGAEGIMLYTQADTEGWYGRFAAARKVTQQSIDSALHNDARETAADFQAAEALREVAAGNRQQARADAFATLQLDQGSTAKAQAALVLAQAGETDAGQNLAREVDRARPLSTLTQQYWLPTIRAAIALEQKDARRALELLSKMGILELSGDTEITLYPAYLRGQAYLMLSDGKSAAGEFRKFIDHYGLVRNFPIGALARLGLARAYAVEAQTDPAARDKARTAYQNFLTLWKDADPDIPIYKQAKAEYAKLQ